MATTILANKILAYSAKERGYFNAVNNQKIFRRQHTGISQSSIDDVEDDSTEYDAMSSADKSTVRALVESGGNNDLSDFPC